MTSLSCYTPASTEATVFWRCIVTLIFSKVVRLGFLIMLVPLMTSGASYIDENKLLKVQLSGVFGVHIQPGSGKRSPRLVACTSYTSDENKKFVDPALGLVGS
jgi:hypothetical protein